MIADLETRFQPEPNTGCFLWTGAYSINGRPVVYDERAKVTVSAYRLAFELRFGYVPSELHHTCRTKECINTDHMFEVDRQTHRRIHITTTEAQRDEALRLRREGLEYTEIGKRIGISRMTAYRMVKLIGPYAHLRVDGKAPEGIRSRPIVSFTPIPTPIKGP